MINETVTYNNTTYGANRTDVTVNGESVDPDEYVRKSGDDVRPVIEGSD